MALVIYQGCTVQFYQGKKTKHIHARLRNIVSEELTLKAERFATTQASTASLPNGIVTFVIGTVKLGPSETQECYLSM